MTRYTELHKTAAKNSRVHAPLFHPLVTTSPAIHRILATVLERRMTRWKRKGVTMSYADEERDWS